MSDQKNIQNIIAPIAAKLSSVAKLIATEIEDDVPLLKEVAEHIINAKGKQIRPALLLLSARIFKEPNNACLVAASAVESIHVATLLHDDVVDNASLRRNKKTANTIWGNEAAVLVGDYLFTSAFERLATLGNIQVLSSMLKCTTSIAKGEIFQLTRSFHAPNLQDYYKIVQFKTGALIATAMKIGAMLSGASDEHSAILEQAGQKIGLAFQITDDVLDYDLTNHNTGKPLGTDLKERKITLPLSHLIAQASASDLAKCQNLLKAPKILDSDIEKIYQLMLKYGSLDFARNEAKKNAAMACEILKQIPENEILSRLIKFVRYIGQRTE